MGDMQMDDMQEEIVNKEYRQKCEGSCGGDFGG
jgi:hypothetical protein